MHIYSPTVLEIKVQNQSHWAKAKMLAGLVPSGGSREDSLFLFSHLEAFCVTWLVTP